MRPWQLSIALGSLLLSAPAHAAEVTVTDGWIRALPGHLPAAGYFVLRNVGSRDLFLTGASSPVCGMLMLHKSSSDNGMANMTDMDDVAIPAGGSVTFAPGGLHLMCVDPKPLKLGSGVPVTLQFSTGKNVTATFVVRNALGHGARQ